MMQAGVGPTPIAITPLSLISCCPEPRLELEKDHAHQASDPGRVLPAELCCLTRTDKLNNCAELL